MNNDCQDILTDEMKLIQVEFKFFWGIQPTSTKNRNKVDKSKWCFHKLIYRLICVFLWNSALSFFVIWLKLFVLIVENLNFLCSLGKELQRVFEKLKIKRLMEAVSNEDAEGIDELWGVSCKQEPYLIFFWNKTTIIISTEPCLLHMIVIADNPYVMPMTICICFML